MAQLHGLRKSKNGIGEATGNSFLLVGSYFIVYRLAVSTGLGAKEISTLTIQGVNLETKVLTVAARHHKSSRAVDRNNFCSRVIQWTAFRLVEGHGWPR